MNYCGRHLQDIGRRLKFLGLWHLVKPDTETKRIAVSFLDGSIKRHEMCPLVIIMLELQAHVDKVLAQRSGRQGGTIRTCPLCAIQRITNDETQDVRSLNGYGQVILRLFQTNGLVSDRNLAEIPEPRKMSIDLRAGTIGR